MKNIQTVLRGALLWMVCVAFLLSNTACFWLLVGGAGAGTYRYMKGDVTRNYPVGLDRGFEVSRQTLQAMNITLSDQQKDSLGGTLEGERSDGSPVKIVLEPAAGDSTTITVRVGRMGNPQMAEEIHEKIRDRL